MAKYSMNSFLKAKQLEEGIVKVNQAARDRLAQMFIDLYMTPGPFADAPYRLGRVLGLAAEEETVSTRSFPPRGITEVTYEDLPFRLGGFKTINDRINSLQGLLREIYGEIRTKITEWDISIYLQELYTQGNLHPDLSDLSLLFRIKEDNLRKYRNHRAYIFGVINAAVSFDRWRRWDPRFDPELQYWVPPTSSLELWAFPPQKQSRVVTYTVRKRKKWWKKKKTVTKSRVEWYTPSRPKLNAYQQREVHKALAGKWTNWFPPYWQLFFWDPDLNSLGEGDEEAIADAHLRSRENSWQAQTASGGSGSRFSLARFRRARRNRSTATAEASLAAANAAQGKGGILGKTVRSAGLNLQSPLWTGRPIGRYTDPRSIAGYFRNDPTSQDTPKIAPTADARHPINRSAMGINQMEGLQRTLNGWATSFLSRQEREVQQWVWRWGWGGQFKRVSVLVGKRWRTVWREGRYEWATLRIPYWVPKMRFGQFPNLTGTLRYVHPQQAKVTQFRNFLFWRSFSTRTRSLPGKFVLEGAIVHNASFRSRFDERDQVPVVMVSADRGTVATVTIQRDTYVQMIPRWVRRRRRWRRRWVLTHVANHVPCYTVHVGTTSQFATKLTQRRAIRRGRFSWRWQTVGQAPITTLAPQTLAGFVASGAKQMRGFFFDLPARSLTDTDNLFTAKWNTVGVGSTLGPTIARGLTTVAWRRRNNNSILAATLPYNLRILHGRLVRIERALKQLARLLEQLDPLIMRTLIDQLPPERANRAPLVLARRRFSGERMHAYRTHLQTVLTSLAPLIEVMGEMSRGTPENRESGLTVKNVRYFVEHYPSLATLIGDVELYGLLDSYLEVMYEWRMIYLQQRMNKIDGTLVQVARIESIDIPTQEGTGMPPSVGDVVMGDILQVVHKTTNVSLAARAEASRAGTPLPTERIHYVYVPVQYDENGGIIRHAAGHYDLLSREYMVDEGAISRVRFFITFTGNQAPPIVNNVITSIDPEELQQIMNDDRLSMIEKICASRQTQDWWKIEIPAQLRPQNKHFMTDVVLMIVPEDAQVEGLLAVLGDATLSPVLEHDVEETALTMAGLNEQTKQAHSTALKSK